MKVDKQEMYPTLKVKDGFSGLNKASVKSIKLQDTRHGQKYIMDIQDMDSQDFFSVFVNVKSMNGLIDSFGGETDKWKEKLVSLNIEQDETYNQDMIVVSEFKE